MSAVALVVPINCMLTVLNLSDTGFQVVQRQVTNLIFETVEIHTRLFVLVVKRMKSGSV